MRFRTATPDLVARAFANAVAGGDLAAAEGWLATASYATAREQERQQHRRQARRAARPRRLAARSDARVVRI